MADVAVSKKETGVPGPVTLTGWSCFIHGCYTKKSATVQPREKNLNGANPTLTKRLGRLHNTFDKLDTSTEVFETKSNHQVLVPAKIIQSNGDAQGQPQGTQI
eukprot:jgi/Botrbrau1/22764/Bobra.0132s0094.1